MDETMLNLFSFNANGLNNRLKRQTVLTWLETNHKGILFIQESHSTSDMEPLWKKEAPNYDIYFSHGTSNSKGVCTMFPKYLNIEVYETISDIYGRFLLIHLNISDVEFVLVNIYAPTKNNPNDQITFLKFIQEKLVRFMGKTIIMSGDFNTYINPMLDKKGGSDEPQTQYSEQLGNLLDELDLYDSYRAEHPNTKCFTWRNRGRAGLVQSRLDMFFVSLHLQFNNVKSYIYPGIRSDHSLIRICLQLNENWKRGRGFYKFNLLLLQDPDYVNKINNTLDELSHSTLDISNKAMRWDYIKCKIRGISISHSSYRAKQNREQELSLLDKLKEVENIISETPTPEYLDQYSNLKNSLNVLYSKKAQGSMIRSKDKFIEENEKKLKVFSKFRKEKLQYKMHQMFECKW